MGKPISKKPIPYRIDTVTTYKEGTLVVLERPAKPTPPHYASYEAKAFLDKNKNGKFDAGDMMISTAFHNNGCPANTVPTMTRRRYLYCGHRSITTRDIAKFRAVVGKAFAKAWAERAYVIATLKPHSYSYSSILKNLGLKGLTSNVAFTDMMLSGARRYVSIARGNLAGPGIFLLDRRFGLHNDSQLIDVGYTNRGLGSNDREHVDIDR